MDEKQKKEYIYSEFPIDDENSDSFENELMMIKNCPSKLYKYRAINNNSINNLINGTMWMSLSDSLNDPFECEVSFYQNKERLEKLVSKGEECAIVDAIDDEEVKSNTMQLIRRGAEEKLRQSYDNFRQEVAIGSFSEEYKSIPMWSYYANNHQGICIEYDFFELRNILQKVYPVIYQKELHDVSIMKNSSRLENYIMRALLTKSADWKHENEWRVVFTYCKVDNGFNICVPKPKKIYLGARISDGDRETINYICSKKGINVSRLLQSKTSYDFIEDSSY